MAIAHLKHKWSSMWEAVTFKFDRPMPGEGVARARRFSDEALSRNETPGTKLGLGRAYFEIGDTAGAKEILLEVAEQGNEHQRQEALNWIERINILPKREALAD